MTKLSFAKDSFTALKENYSGECTVLMGPPGSGKTTILSRMVIDIEESGEDWTVLIVPCAIYNNNPNLSSVYQAAALHYQTSWSTDSISSIESFIQHEIKNERLLLFVDSLDEASPELRKKIVTQIQECDVPRVASSRYCEPALDGNTRITNSVFHVGALRIASIISYLKSIRQAGNGLSITQSDRLATEAPEGRSSRLDVTLSNLISRFEKLNASRGEQGWEDCAGEFFEANFDTLVSKTYSDTNQYLGAEEAIGRIRRREREWLAMLSSPIHLNLYLAICIEHGMPDTSPDLLVKQYVDLLLGKWKKSRSHHPSGIDSHDVDQSSVIGGLSCLAVSDIVREHCSGKFLSTQGAIEELTAHFQNNDYTLRPTEALRKKAIAVLEAATDAGLLVFDEAGIRFSSPHELFTTYFASVQLSRTSDASSVFSAGPASKTRNRSCASISFDSFLSNPNLRFLEDSVVLYLQSRHYKVDISPHSVAQLLDDLVYRDPIHSRFTGCDSDDIEAIIPSNLILAGRVFSIDSLRRTYEKKFEPVRKKICEIYFTTNFEFLFQAVAPIYRSFDKGQGDSSRGATGSERSFDNLDRAWRSAATFESLESLARAVEKGGVLADSGRTAEENKGIIVRRIAYMMRYFDKPTCSGFEWLTELYERYRNESPTRRWLVLDTIRMINNGHKIKSPQLARQFDAWLADKTDIAHQHKRHFMNRLESHGHSLRNNVEFVERVWEDDSIQLEHLDIFPVEMAGRFAGAEISFPRVISFLGAKLTEIQAKREIMERKRAINSEWENLKNKEAKTVRLLINMTDTFAGQQFFMPEVYSLDDLGGFWPSEVGYDRETLLRQLFSGAMTAKNARGNLNVYSVGMWQLYDYYVQAIWSIMRYIPNQANYSYWG